MRGVLALACALLMITMLCAGCEKEQPQSKPEPVPTKQAKKAETKKAAVGRNVWLETQGERRRVLVEAYVCLREGMLEQLLCRKHTKEHEAILAADIDARDIHKALLVTGIEPGSPAKYEPAYKPASGPEVKVSLQYEDKGQLATIPAQKWIRYQQSKKELENNWVFTGSRLFHDPSDKTKEPYYAANGGDVICVSNFEDALLDLPVRSDKDNSELAFEAFAERIPPLGTKVIVILEPAAASRNRNPKR